MRIAPRRGWPGRFAGRAANLARMEVYRADTHRASGLYPFLHGASLPPIGAYIGHNTLTSQAFSAHPSAWVKEGLVTNPNVMITGIPGSGKSAHIKALCFRLMVFGQRTLIAGDVKGEYAELCRHLGTEPVRLGPGLPGRLNPLDAGPLGHNLDKINGEELAARLTEIRRRRLTLIRSLLELQLRRTLQPHEGEALRAAVRQVTGELAGTSPTRLQTPTLPMVYRVLQDPTPEMAHELRVRGEDIQLAREQMASLRSALGEMIDGHLGGLFDQQTSIELDWDAPIQSVDISALQEYGDETVAMVLTCVSSWAQSAIDQPGRPWIVVRDELWRQLQSGGAAMVRKIDSDLRLSRASGTIQVLATHRLSDLEAVPDAATLARELIASCETRIQLAQDTRPLRMTREAIGLTSAECDLIGSWGAAQRGRALWKVGRGGGSHAVQLILSSVEERLFETDEKMIV
ncbi:type VI secretion protein [Streptomyces sp. G-5]|uniref:type VI secretion protein n=1 Tax=Streptomyces sp. G-5 TaxID=2977231 RepID=UPI003977A2E1